MDFQRRTWDAGTDSRLFLNFPFPPFAVSSLADFPEVSNLPERRTISEQNNIKQSDVLSKVPLEIEVLNGLYTRNEFTQVDSVLLARKPQSDSYCCQSLEDTSECVDLEENASDSEEDNIDSELNRVKDLDLFLEASHLPKTCKVKWPVCKRYPEFPLFTIEIEQPDFQTVSC